MIDLTTAERAKRGINRAGQPRPASQKGTNPLKAARRLAATLRAANAKEYPCGHMHTPNGKAACRAARPS